MKYRTGHGGRWQGGRTLRGDGYVLILQPDGKRVMEHRVVMEAHLGRALLPDEVVHHINGVKDDNRIENLQLTDRWEHPRLHIVDRWSINFDACTKCGRTSQRCVDRQRGLCMTCQRTLKRRGEL
jgi:tellurite resistance-related uncharacterized protein